MFWRLLSKSADEEVFSNFLCFSECPNFMHVQFSGKKKKEIKKRLCRKQFLDKFT